MLTFHKVDEGGANDQHDLIDPPILDLPAFLLEIEGRKLVH
jgi:hypothetical protein